MKLIKTISSIGSWVIVFVILFFAVLLILGKMNNPLGLRVFTVLSGSMEPTIKTGSLVTVKSQDDYHDDDIVTVKSESSQKKETVTHRINKTVKSEENGVVKYELKGDANEEPDAELVNKNRVIGKVITTIPYLGKVVAFTQTQIGFVLVIIIPATLIIYSEVMSIKNELVKMLKNRNSSKTHKETSVIDDEDVQKE